MITSSQVNDLVEQYAPIVIFNSQEEYFLTSAERYIANCDVVSTAEGDGLCLKDREPQTLAGSMDDAMTYVNVKVYQDDGCVDIQYWLLYAFNGPGTLYIKYLSPRTGFKYESVGDQIMTPCGQHEGDWEHITVRVSLEDGSLQKVYYAQHRAGVWQDGYPQPGKYPERTVFYSSKFGHAAYPTMGRNYTETNKSLKALEFRLVNDTETPGKLLDMQGRCHTIGLQINGEDMTETLDGWQRPDWMNLTGRWGEVVTERPIEPALTLPIPVLDELGFDVTIKDVMEKIGIYDQCEQEFGPLPPWSKPSWQGDENT